MSISALKPEFLSASPLVEEHKANPLKKSGCVEWIKDHKKAILIALLVIAVSGACLGVGLTVAGVLQGGLLVTKLSIVGGALDYVYRPGRIWWSGTYGGGIYVRQWVDHTPEVLGSIAGSGIKLLVGGIVTAILCLPVAGFALGALLASKKTKKAPLLNNKFRLIEWIKDHKKAILLALLVIGSGICLLGVGLALSAGLTGGLLVTKASSIMHVFYRRWWEFRGGEIASQMVALTSSGIAFMRGIVIASAGLTVAGFGTGALLASKKSKTLAQIETRRRALPEVPIQRQLDLKTQGEKSTCDRSYLALDTQLG